MKKPNQKLQLKNQAGSRALLTLLFLIIALALAAGGYFVYQREADAIKNEKYRDLQAIGNLKINQIVSWRNERINDARLNSASPLLRDAVVRLKTRSQDAELIEAMLSSLKLVRDSYHYDNVILADTDGGVLLSCNPHLNHLEPETKKLVAEAASSYGVVFGDFFRCHECGQIHLDVAAPMIDDENQPMAVLILRVDPETFLYPLIQSWPLPSRSGETLLVGREGDEVVFLNTLRFRTDPALSIRLPLSRADLPAARAVLGQTGFFEGRDYRGVPVISYIHPVPDSPWFMVAKIDRDEIFAELNQRAVSIGLFTLALMAVAGAGISFIYKHQGKRAFEALYIAEKERAEAKEEFETTLYSIGDAVITADVAGCIRRMNPVAEQLTGWQEKDAVGRPADEVFHIINETTRQKAENPIQKVLEKGIIVGLANHTLLISKDGEEIPIADSGAPIRDEDGNITGVVLVFRDQRQEREKEKLILAQLQLLEYAASHPLEEFLQKTLDEAGAITNSPIGFFHFVDADQKALTLQAWSTRTVNEFCAAQAKGMHYSIDQAGVWVDCVYAKKPVIHNDYASLSHKKGMPEGHAPVIRELVVPVIRGDRIAAVLGVGNKPSDYTEKDVEIVAYLAEVAWERAEKKQKEEMLNRLIRRQESLLAAIPDIVMEVDLNKVYTWANSAGIDFFGDDVIGKEASYYFEGDQNTYDIVQPLFDGQEEVIYVESWQRRKDGKKRLLAWWCKVLKDENGNPTGGLSSARDITDHRMLENQLIQSQKMESVGRLAGGVAHDFNNMLGVIIGNAEMSLGQVKDGDPIRTNLLEILAAARRSADLTRQLLAFARKQTIDPKVLDLNDAVASMLSMLRRLIGEDIDLTWKPGHDLRPVKIDPIQIDQILANLLVNAKDAIAGGGNVTIETANVVFDETYCEAHVGFVPGRFVMLAVSDSGIGMDEDALRHIFEPFYTTKEVGKGTGLGLSTVYGIVKQNNGFINVYSEPGQGTTFKIYLPEADRPLEAPKESFAAKPLNGSETVLLVEDEAAILKLGKSILHRHGYIVLTAQTPHEALSVADSHPGVIHLLITDVVMPGMNGGQLKEKLTRLHPGLKCLFMSGYTANTIAHHGVLDEGIHFLQKPFSVKTLAEKVRMVLDQQT